MADQARKAPFAWGTLIVGLVLGIVVGAVGGVLAPRLQEPPAPPSPWVDAAVTWTTLPGQATVGAAPQAFTLPAKAWDYAAISAPLGGLALARPSILRVDIQVASGRAGVSLATPDGQALVSPEKAVGPADGARSLYFPIGGDQTPVAILVRNYDAPNQGGAATVSAVRYAREDGLTTEELSAINAAP